MLPFKILTIVLILLSIIGIRSYNYYKTLPVYQDGQKIKVLATVTEEPKISYGKQRVKVKTRDGVRITVVTQAAPIYQYGDDLVLDGVFTKERFEDYEYWVIYFPNLQIAKNDHNSITSAAYGIRNEAKDLFESTLPPVASSLLLGIVLGGKHGMPDAFLENLRTVGVLHVIAASGMNVSFVAVFLVAVLGKVLRRHLALFTAIIGIGFYVTVAGFEPSIVRAAIMSTLALTASLLGRPSAAIITLCITGYVMLTVSPGLWEDIGFHLSFLSTLGILVVKPLLAFGKNIFFSDDVGTTVAAQIATLPILLGVFGNYGLLSVLINAMILWTVPLLMALGSLAILLGNIFEPLGKLPLFLSYPFLWYFETVVNFFGGSGWVLEIPELPITVWVGYYLILGAIIFRNKKKVLGRKETMILRES